MTVRQNSARMNLTDTLLQMRGCMATLTRADIAQSIYQSIGLSRAESAELVDTVLEEICAALVRGEDVKLSSFAILSPRLRRERVGRNPKTGEDHQIAARCTVSFAASKVMKARIQDGHVARQHVFDGSPETAFRGPPRRD